MSNKDEQEAKAMLWGVGAFIVVSLLAVIVIWLTIDLPNESYWPNSLAVLLEVARNAGLLGVGGLGIWLAWRRIQAMETQNKTGLDSLALAQQEHRDERFERNVSLLESDNEFSRLAAMGGLNKLAFIDPANYLGRTVELLCAFLRAHRKASDRATRPGVEVTLAFEIVNRLVVWRYKNPDVSPKPIANLQGVSLDFITLTEWQSTMFEIGAATFRHAVFDKCQILPDLMDTRSLWKATFNECEFVGDFAFVDFSGCRFQSCEIGQAVFNECEMRGISAYRFKKEKKTERRPHFRSCQIDDAIFGMKVHPDSPAAIRERAGDYGMLAPEDFERCWITNSANMPEEITDRVPPLIPHVVRKSARRNTPYMVAFSEHEQ